MSTMMVVMMSKTMMVTVATLMKWEMLKFVIMLITMINNDYGRMVMVVTAVTAVVATVMVVMVVTAVVATVMVVMVVTAVVATVVVVMVVTVVVATVVVVMKIVMARQWLRLDDVGVMVMVGSS
ncbi:hypothetical protein HispidOSU_017091 [Sigmodon hispidus]